MAKMALTCGEDRQCRPFAFAPTQGQRQLITRSVGEGGVNRTDDVRTIQSKLNQAQPPEARPAPPLVEDGICGPKTRAAIRKFQSARRLKVVDGRVDPKGPTEMLLRDGLGADEAENQAFLESVGADIPVIRGWISHAKQTLGTASDYVQGGSRGPIQVLTGEKEYRLVDKYFHISALNKDAQVTYITQVGYVLDDMQMVLSQSLLMMKANGWGCGYFQPDPQDGTEGTKGYIAYTFPNGWREPDDADLPRFDRDHPGSPLVREDGIYLVTSKYRINTADFMRCVLIHEMAHFVGSRVGHFYIVDEAYFTKPGFEQIGSERARRNADSYAGFIAENATGRDPKTL